MKHILLSALLICGAMLSATAATPKPPLKARAIPQTIAAPARLPLAQPLQSQQALKNQALPQSDYTDANWVSLGYGTYHNAFFFENDYKVEVQLDLYTPGRYRLVEPYTQGFSEEGYGVENPPQYVEFQMVAPGETIPNTSIVVPENSGEYFLYIPSYNTGWHYPIDDSDVDVYAMYGADFNYTTLSEFSGQRVLVWKYYPGYHDEYGSPGGVSMGCRYSLYGTDYFLTPDMLKNTKDITFTFPGSHIPDYTFTLSEAEKYEAGGKTCVQTYVEFTGDDTELVVVGLVDTTVASEAVGAVEDLYYELVNPSDSPVISGLVTLRESGYASFELPGAGVYTIAAISVRDDYSAEAETVRISHYDNTGWTAIGKGRMTDGMLSDMYSSSYDAEGYSEYEVEVWQNDADENLYRIADIYSPSTWPIRTADFTWSGAPMDIDVSNPDCVRIPEFCAGSIDGFGNVYFESASEYYSRAGYSESAIIAAGINGTLRDGVVSFPAPVSVSGGKTSSMVMYLPDYDAYAGRPMVANKFGTFRVVLPAAQTIGSVDADAEGDATVVAWYNLQGMKLTAPVKGVNIALCSDGTRRKVIR